MASLAAPWAGLWGLDSLERRRLKILRTDQLNDPFELLGFEVNVDATDLEHASYASNQLVGRFHAAGPTPTLSNQRLVAGNSMRPSATSLDT